MYFNWYLHEKYESCAKNKLEIRKVRVIVSNYHIWNEPNGRITT